MTTPPVPRHAAPVSPGLFPVGVSVVIPVKNDVEALERCLDALSRQTTPVGEVIVVDNASTDDPGAVARRWGARLLYEGEPGIPAAASRGYSAARFSVIARLDADSVPPPGWVAAGLEALSEHPDAAAVTGPGTFYDGPRRGSRMIAAVYLGSYFRSIRLAVGAVPLFGSTFFLRTAVWHQVASSVHRWGTSLHDDLDLTIHLTPGHRIHFEPAVAVGISFRPFTEWRTLGFRFYRGFVTLALHWPADSALLRFRRGVHRRARRLVAAVR